MKNLLRPSLVALVFLYTGRFLPTTLGFRSVINSGNLWHELALFSLNYQWQLEAKVSNSGENEGQTCDKERIPPSVTLKIAFDSNWGIAEGENLGEHKRFTSPASLDMVHRLRRVSDCVLVGRTTVELDDCTLTVRRVNLVEPNHKQPARVILDTSLKIFQQIKEGKPSFAILQGDEATPPTIVYHNVPDAKIDKKLSEAIGPHVRLVELSNGLLPKNIVNDLQEKQFIQHIMVEGGTSNYYVKYNTTP